MKRMSVLAAVLALSSTLSAAQPYAPVKWTLDGDSATLSFDAKRVARGLWFAWGDSDAGGRTNGWTRVEKLADVEAQAAGVSVTLPAAFDASSQKGRFFLFDVYDARSYVQDGLVLHLDARDNAGVGRHDASPAAWKDLAGDCDVALDGIAYNDSSVVFPLGGQSVFKLPMLETNADKTLEAIAWTDDTYPTDIYGRTDVVSVGNDLNFAFRGDSIFMMAIFCDAADADGRQIGRYYYGAGVPSASAAGIREPHAYALVQSSAAPSASSVRVDASRYVVAENGCVWSNYFMHTNVVAIGMSTARTHFSAVRLYSRALSAEELAFNAAVDKVRYFNAEAPFSASPLVPDSADATVAGSVVCASWNIGHFANGTSNASKIPAGEAETWRSAYSNHLDAIGADWFGVCEWSDAFVSDGSVSAREAVFGRYPFASIGPRNSYQCNGAFANGRFTLLETVTNRYGSHVQDTYYVAHRVLVDDAVEAWFVQTHNDWAEGAFRTNQADQLIGDFLDKPRVVISGDFNNFCKMADGTTSTTAWNYPARFMAAGYHVFNTGALGATCGGMAIDNFYVKGFAISGGVVHADDALSDHRAISCRLTPLVPLADGRTSVAIPANPPAALYTGAVQTPYVTSDPGYTVAWGEISADAGEYAGTASLVDPERTCWTDGTTAPKPLTFTVAQNANRWTSAPSLSPTTWFIEGDSPDFSLGASLFGTPSANYTAEELAALPVGDYVLAVTVPATPSYAGLATNIPFKVAQKFVPTLSEDGRSVGLAFGASAVDRTLWIVYDEADRGADMDGWRNLVALGTVPAGSSSWTATLPDDVGSRYGAFRFILMTASMGADAYVQDGLVAQWDAIENAGRGVHEAAPAVWKDLAGTRDIPTNSFSFGAASATLASNVTVTLPFGAVMAADATKTVEGVFRTDETFDAWNMARMDVLNAGNDGAIAFRNVDGCHRIGIFTDAASRHAYYTYNADAAFAGNSRILSNASYSAVFAPDVAQSSLRIDGAAFTKGIATDAGGKNYYHDVASGFAHHDNLQLQNFSRANLHYSSIRVYGRALTDDERNANYAVDKARFLGGDANADATDAVQLPVPFRADVDKRGRAAEICLMPTNFVRSLYVAWAGGDRGETTNAWPNVRRLCDVPAGAGVLECVPLPAEAMDATGVRFFLVCEFDAGSYVQDGLVAQWDAIENAGRGAHEAAPAVWKDLAGTRDIPTNSFSFGAASATLASNVTVTLPFGAVMAADATKTVEGVFRTDETFDAWNMARMDVLNAGNDGAIAFRNVDGCHRIGIFTDAASRHAYYTYNADAAFAGKSRILSNASYSAVFAPDVAQSSLRVDGAAFTKGIATDAGGKNYYHDVASGFAHHDNLQLQNFSRANLHYSSIRVYGRALTDDERVFNAMVDRSRYCGETPTPLATPYVRLQNGLSVLIR